MQLSAKTECQWNYRIGILCDMHMSGEQEAPQYAFLKRAVCCMKADGVEKILCLGDVTRFGEKEGWNLYQETTADFEHYDVLGNSEVRDDSTEAWFRSLEKPFSFRLGTRTVFGIHTPDGRIEEADRVFLQDAKEGDLICMHHYPESMEEGSREWLEGFLDSRSLLVLHGHGHRVMERIIGKSKVYGMRGMDPDKAIGDYPSYCLLEVSEQDVKLREKRLDLSGTILGDIRKYLGLSCANNARDVAYATEHDVRFVELRCNGRWERDPADILRVSEWREKTNGYLSIHMPNLEARSGFLKGQEQWEKALEFALEVNADGFTMHPPRAKVSDMIPGSALWQELLSLYLLAAERVPKGVKLGIENLHKGPAEELDENRGFGYTPEEVSAWIDALNEACGEKRFGHVLDVGHARNNGRFASIYPVSAWYTLMGDKTVAYHIHQVKSGTSGFKNHNAIEDWFGPVINYTGFWYAWGEEILNHVPAFLEVEGCENYEKSVEAFEKII